VKCQLGISAVLFGLSCTYIPVLYTLIVCFPERNKYSQYLSSHKYQFLCCFIVLELVINMLYLLSPFSKEDIIFGDTKNQKNYSRCTMNDTIGKVITIVDIVIKGISILAILLLSFIDWNVKEICKDIRILVATIYINILILVLLAILENIHIDNYEVYHSIYNFILIIMSISNYIVLNSFKNLIARKDTDQPITAYTTSNSKADTSTISNNSNPNIFVKILNYHEASYSIETQSPTSVNDSSKAFYSTMSHKGNVSQNISSSSDI